jgi:hypothetical protein
MEKSNKEDWKPEVWYGYNEKEELIYNKFTDEEN